MKPSRPQDSKHTRRELLALGAGAILAPAAGSVTRPATAQQTVSGKDGSGLNLVFVFTDQERYQQKWPAGLSLPGHERLARSGITFHNHYCPAVMCTSSRSVLLTGLQTVDTGMFENVDTPWVKSLSTKIPTVGHMLRKAGYYTAYKGKWHLSRNFDVEEPDRPLTKEMEEYGFADLFSPGDIIGHTLGGYSFDHLIAGSTITWLRRKGRALADQGKPWGLFVSLVNPHDIMYFNTDAPGQNVQDTGRLLMHAARAPESAFYRATWDVPLPDSLRHPLGAVGRPKAHNEFLRIWDYTLGNIPMEEERWRRFNDYYINCIRAVDLQIAAILQEIEDLGLADRTVVVFTSDHGEAAGAHGLRGKGPFAYQETMHLPFYMIHPDVAGGQDCRALTSHIDFVPTLLAMAGVKPDHVPEIAGRTLPGKDLTGLLASPGGAAVDAARDAALFTYSGLATNDGALIEHVASAVAAGKNPKEELKKAGFRPDLKKRGSLRTVFDGHYKFSRYFSPLDHNLPTTLEELFAWNDVELFDLEADPNEMVNMAMNKEDNRDLLVAMNAKLTALIKAEIGKDDGRELPDLPGVTWTIDRIDM